MTWRLTRDVDTYAEHTMPLLRAHPAENTVALTVTAGVQAGRRWSTDPMLFGWYEHEGLVTGAVSRTPPHELLLAEVPQSAVQPLVEALLGLDVSLPGINGESSTAAAFAFAWCERRGVLATSKRRERLYRLHALVPPRQPGGRARAATTADTELAVDWFTRFQIEAGTHPVDPRPTVQDRVDHQLLWLWEGAGGQVVSMAARNQAAAGVARVGPVYTPPEHRRRGFGAAVTAACTSDALARDAQDVVLFTDVANAASNASYQHIGYRPVRDHEVVVFGRPAAVADGELVVAGDQGLAAAGSPEGVMSRFALMARGSCGV